MFDQEKFFPKLFVEINFKIFYKNEISKIFYKIYSKNSIKFCATNFVKIKKSADKLKFFSIKLNLKKIKNIN